MQRIHSIDAMRGLVMIIMALDHVRDFIHVTAQTQNPTDLSTTTAAIFITRWVTHLCAPTFVFLSGMSAFLTHQRLGTETSSYLFKRGLWLILLEFTVIGFAMWFDFRYRTMLFEVIGAIGFGFVMLALLIRLSPTVLTIAGLVIVFGHNLLGSILFSEDSMVRTLLTPLFFQAPYPISENLFFIVAYPPIPWLGIMLVGYGMGRLFQSNAERQPILFKTGMLCVLLFIVIRAINVYGDIPWSQQKTPLYSILSFINITKYPPSLLFTLSMIGLMLLFMAWMEGRQNRLMDILITYGRVPLFYFIVHLYLIHGLMLVIVLAQGHLWQDLNFGIFGQGRPKGESGLGLAGVYLIWAGVVAALYPLCRWYARIKSESGRSMLKYL